MTARRVEAMERVEAIGQEWVEVVVSIKLWSEGPVEL